MNDQEDSAAKVRPNTLVITKKEDDKEQNLMVLLDEDDEDDYSLPIDDSNSEEGNAGTTGRTGPLKSQF